MLLRSVFDRRAELTVSLTKLKQYWMAETLLHAIETRKTSIAIHIGFVAGGSAEIRLLWPCPPGGCLRTRDI
jgi:hypothetical protein